MEREFGNLLEDQNGNQSGSPQRVPAKTSPHLTLLSLVLAHFVIWSRADNFGHGAFIGILSWIGFVVSPLYPQSIYEGRPFLYFGINAGYWLIGLAVAGGLLAVWP